MLISKEEIECGRRTLVREVTKIIYYVKTVGQMLLNVSLAVVQ